MSVVDDSYDRFIVYGIVALQEKMSRTDPSISPGFDCVFENEVFSMCYSCVDCDCCGSDSSEHNYHEPSCYGARANFQCGEFKAWWYRHPGRDFRTNQYLSLKEILEMLMRCEASLP